MASKTRLLMISGGAVFALFVLYVGIFYYQHERSGQRVIPQEDVATSTQIVSGVPSENGSENATSTRGEGGIPTAEEASSTVYIPAVTAPCRISGCSGEICAEGNLVSTCIYRSEYACYKTATCERQKTGACGWTETPELLSCVADKKSGGQVVMPQ